MNENQKICVNFLKNFANAAQCNVKIIIDDEYYPYTEFVEHAINNDQLEETVEQFLKEDGEFYLIKRRKGGQNGKKRSSTDI